MKANDIKGTCFSINQKWHTPLYLWELVAHWHRPQDIDQSLFHYTLKDLVKRLEREGVIETKRFPEHDETFWKPSPHFDIEEIQRTIFYPLPRFNPVKTFYDLMFRFFYIPFHAPIKPIKTGRK